MSLESENLKDHNVSATSCDQKTGEEGFVIECSDDEKYEITVEDMITVYKRIADGDLELCQKLVRVRSPSPDQMEEQFDEGVKNEQEQQEEVAEEKSVAIEFDFDNFTETSKLITPRRNVGFIKAPRNTQKRVAQWDKIMNDYLKYQKMEEGEKSTFCATKIETSVVSFTTTAKQSSANDIDVMVTATSSATPLISCQQHIPKESNDKNKMEIIQPEDNEKIKKVDV